MEQTNAIITKIEGNKITFDCKKKNGRVEQLANWVKVEYVELGNAVITIEDGKISYVTMDNHIQTEEKKSNKPKSDKRWEDDIVSFETLLTKAHALKAPFSIKTEMLAIDLEKKYALFKATVIVEMIGTNYPTPYKIVYEGHGDATDANVKGEHIKPHFIRMAETRAICRALRWYTNNGCAEEEK